MNKLSTGEIVSALTDIDCSEDCQGWIGNFKTSDLDQLFAKGLVEWAPFEREYFQLSDLGQLVLLGAEKKDEQAREGARVMAAAEEALTRVRKARADRAYQKAQEKKSAAEIAGEVHEFSDYHRTAMEQSLSDQ